MDTDILYEAVVDGDQYEAFLGLVSSAGTLKAFIRKNGEIIGQVSSLALAVGWIGRQGTVANEVYADYAGEE